MEENNKLIALKAILDETFAKIKQQSLMDSEKISDLSYLCGDFIDFNFGSETPVKIEEFSDLLYADDDDFDDDYYDDLDDEIRFGDRYNYYPYQIRRTGK